MIMSSLPVPYPASLDATKHALSADASVAEAQSLTLFWQRCYQLRQALKFWVSAIHVLAQYP